MAPRFADINSVEESIEDYATKTQKRKFNKMLLRLMYMARLKKEIPKKISKQSQSFRSI